VGNVCSPASGFACKLGHQIGYVVTVAHKLGRYFRAVSVKRLNAARPDGIVFSRLDFDGNDALNVLFGSVARDIRALFVLKWDEYDALWDDGHLSWREARSDMSPDAKHSLRIEPNEVTARAKKGDALFVAMRPDETALVVVAPQGSTLESQLFWFFGLQVFRGAVYPDKWRIQPIRAACATGTWGCLMDRSRRDAQRFMHDEGWVD
jgi:hypothetical protein